MSAAKDEIFVEGVWGCFTNKRKQSTVMMLCFLTLASQRHCLQTVSGIPDTIGYQEFFVIRNCSKMAQFYWISSWIIPDYIS
jgi:hypothetical protein